MPPPTSSALVKNAPLITILALQSICAIYLVRDMALSVLGIQYEPLAWQYLEYLDIGAALGLVAGIALGARMLVHSLRKRDQAEESLRRAKSAFMQLVQQRFDEWGLSPAERDVALFSIKGLSVAEIASLRGTSDGTIKAQAAAVYRKAGVGNRHQLLSLFIEDLFDPQIAPFAEAASAASEFEAPTHTSSISETVTAEMPASSRRSASRP